MDNNTLTDISHSSFAAKTFFDKSSIEGFVNCFYKATGIPTSIHTFVMESVQLQVISAGTHLSCSLCTFLRRECFPRFRRACFDENHKMIARAKKQQGAIIYRCHMGLCEAIIPIKTIEDELSLIYLGRVDTEPATEEGFVRAYERATATDHAVKNADMSELRRLYYEMPRMSEDEFRNAVRLAEYYADLMSRDNKNVKFVPQSYIETVKQFVKASLHLQISRNAAAEHIGISPGYLSHIMSKEEGCSFSDYVTKQKMELAKQELLSSNAPVGEIARRCGYDNPKYFSTLFKKHTGMTPTQYKNSCKSKTR